MPWICTKPMEERTKFVHAYQDGFFSVSELCKRFSISRKTGYKWIARYEEGGLDALFDRSRAPKSCPHKTPEEVEDIIVKCRGKHSTWGPKKLRPYLAKRHDIEFPAISTIGAILDRHGLIEPRRIRRSSRHPGAPCLTTTAPNDIWTTDFKGEFKTKDGVYCFPLTVCDAQTRFILDVRGLYSTKQKGAIPVFERLFETYGLPLAIRTDNGVPFATRAICGLSKLSVWWIKLGIGHQRIEPGEPTQNGTHERMHRTLKAETARPPASSMRTQQKAFDFFRAEFNDERPHEALDFESPGALYIPSPRPMPSKLPRPDYPGHFEIRRVSCCGTFRLNVGQIFLSQTLNHEWIGLEETDDGIWDIYFYDVLLARLDERDFNLYAAVP